MPEEIQKMCANCNKGEDRTGEPCPTRAGCFTPLYLNWEPISQEPEYASDYFIKAFTYDGEFVVTLENTLSGRSEIVAVTVEDIIGLLKL